MKIENKYEKLLHFFYEISKIPRNSTEENQISDFLCEFAKSRNLEYRKDDFYNVLIKKKASFGYEDRKPIILQAHTDMVCERTIDSNHNFKLDPIEIINNGNVLKAKDTTLGADDGIGVAILLLMLDDNEISHPEMYCLFTTQEEIGMDGAKHFDYSDISASYLINVDGEEENTAIVGCAGGARLTFEKNVELEESVNENIYEINVSGLRGGHSGVDINKGRLNANYIIAQILEQLDDVKIVSFVGGTKDNAIPNLSRCIFASKVGNNIIREKIENIKNNLNIVDEDININISLKKVTGNFKVASIIESQNIVSLLLNLKQNVIKLSEDKEGLVETSGNVGIVDISNGKCTIKELIRSSIDYERKRIEEININMAKEKGYLIKKESEYPGWKYNPNSRLEKIYIEAYEKTHDGEYPKVEAIHAGVECGMIFEKMPNLELISIGPDIVDVHTVNETLFLDSCRKILKTIFKMIELLD